MTDLSYDLNGVSFVWDRRKARENVRLHEGVTFERAAEAFFDPFFRIIEASRKDELRHKLIGYDTSNRLLVVIHVEWQDEAIRIISAWPATAAERGFYDS
jgi:uncharacterized DUF497 family protein